MEGAWGDGVLFTTRGGQRKKRERGKRRGKGEVVSLRLQVVSKWFSSGSLSLLRDVYVTGEPQVVPPTTTDSLNIKSSANKC